MWKIWRVYFSFWYISRSFTLLECYLLPHKSTLVVSLDHPNSAKDSSVSPSLPFFNSFSFLPLTGATKAFCIRFALVIGFTDNCIEFALVSLKAWWLQAFAAVTQLTLGPCINGFINATVLNAAALIVPVESQPYNLAIF